MIIRIRPVPELRRAFARWAVAQRPKVRTVSESDFGVPADLLEVVPADLLNGALVDGRPLHWPPTLPETAAEPGEALTEVPSSAYAPGSVPLPVHPAEEEQPSAEEEQPPAEEEQPAGSPAPAALAGGPSDEPQADDGGETPCGVCSRSFRSERAAATHRRQAHAETKGL